MSRLGLFLVALAVLSPYSALAVPIQVPYSGQLTEGGTLVNGTRSMTFVVYDAAAGGSALYTQPEPAVTVTDGVYHQMLSVPASVWDGSDRWLGVTVGAGAELIPRTKIGSVPYASRANVADNLSSIPAQPFAGSSILTPAQQVQVNAWVGNPFRTWTVCYRKSMHGPSSMTFHTQCNARGPSVTVVKLSNGFIIGGYTDISWSSCSCYQPYGSNFLFSLNAGKKYPIGSNRSLAVYQNVSYGPTFGGGHDMYINSTMNLEYSNFPTSYDCNGIENAPNSSCQVEFCGVSAPTSVVAIDLEVWVQP